MTSHNDRLGRQLIPGQVVISGIDSTDIGIVVGNTKQRVKVARYNSFRSSYGITDRRADQLIIIEKDRFEDTAWGYDLAKLYVALLEDEII